jgi:hypothetical protein
MLLNGITEWLIGLLGTIGLGAVGHIYSRTSRHSRKIGEHERSLAVLDERFDGIDEKQEEHVAGLRTLQASISSVALAVARIEGRLET